MVDSFMLTRIIRQRVPFVRQPVIIIVADPERAQSEQFCIANGADAAITQPLQLKDVSQVLLPLTRSYRSHNKNQQAKSKDRGMPNGETVAIALGSAVTRMDTLVSLAPTHQSLVLGALGMAALMKADVVFVLSSDLSVLTGNAAFHNLTHMNDQQVSASPSLAKPCTPFTYRTPLSRVNLQGCRWTRSTQRKRS